MTRKLHCAVTTLTIIGCLFSTHAISAQKNPRQDAKQAQQTNTVDPTEPRLLVPTHSIPVRAIDHGLLSKLTCDADQNIFIRVAQSDDMAMMSDPYEKYSASGEKRATFNVPSMPDRRIVADGLEIGGDGDIYIPVTAYAAKPPTQSVGYVFQYDKDGKLKNKVLLDFPVKPRVALVFKSGTMLVSGVQIPTAEDSSRTTPFTGLFDADGKLLKRITLADDQSLKDKADLGDSTVSGEHAGYNRAVEWGDGTVGSDGNAYLLRAISPATIYVVSPSGEVVRTLTVDSKESGLTPYWIQESGGNLAILFIQLGAYGSTPPKKVIKVVNRQGDEVATYDPTPIVAPLLCYSAPATFTFAGHESGKVLFIEAQPR